MEVVGNHGNDKLMRFTLTMRVTSMLKRRSRSAIRRIYSEEVHFGLIAIMFNQRDVEFPGIRGPKSYIICKLKFDLHFTLIKT